MASAAFTLPLLPEGWTAEKDFKKLGTLTPASQRNLEAIGPHFLAHARRKRHHRTFSEDDRIQAQQNVKNIEDEDAGEISEPEDPVMLSRDAKDWKNQDHYAVLGLSKYRFKATDEQIKKAHRKKVLKHHPDKKAAQGGAEDDNFFKCIQKATEVLLDPVRRRQFDSVDEGADVEPPTKSTTKKGNFYKLWGRVFESEGRFSKTQPVPKLGNEKSSKEDVEHFYNFWYNFDSWRSFEYQDEDVPDDNESRDHKRHVEKKNLNARKKKKTEDTARLRSLVDECLGLDERIKLFKQAERAQKNKKKNEREAEAKRLAEEAAAKKEAEAKAKAAAEEEEKQSKANSKKAKEAAKNAARKNKRALRQSVTDSNYFAEGTASASVIEKILGDLDKVVGAVDNEGLAALTASATGKKGVDLKKVLQESNESSVKGGKLKEGDVTSFA